MPSIVFQTFENEKLVLHIDWEKESGPDKSKFFYNPRSKREAELAELANTIITKAIGRSSKPKKVSHEKSNDPIKGYTLIHENNDFRIKSHISSGYHSEYSVGTNIWREDKKAAMHAEIMVPPYSPPYGGEYVVSRLGLTIGNQGEPYDLVPHGNIADENVWELHKYFIKNTIYSALQLRPEEIARKIS